MAIVIASVFKNFFMIYIEDVGVAVSRFNVY